MITLLTGENSFEKERELARIIEAAEEAPEKFNGEGLELSILPDLLMGATLFSEKRLVIIKNLSENSALWASLTDWLPRMSDDIHLVLVEEKPDKRTKTFKDLQKVATVKEFKAWNERDAAAAEKWVIEEAARLGARMDKKSAHHLVARVGVGQWLLYQALQKLALLDATTPEVIDEVIEPNPTENIFYLFEAALKGDTQRVMTMLATLKFTEDPYRLFGLLSNQASNLLALSLTDKSSSEVAKDLGVHPFALQKLAPFAKNHGKEGKNVIKAMIQADETLKTSATDPWIAIEGALVKVALDPARV